MKEIKMLSKKIIFKLRDLEIVNRKNVDEIIGENKIKMK